MTKVWHDGKEYESFSALCREYGMNASTVRLRVKKGMSLDDALKYKNLTNQYVVTYKGKTYNNLKELADTYQVDYRILRQEIQKIYLPKRHYEMLNYVLLVAIHFGVNTTKVQKYLHKHLGYLVVLF